MATELWRLQDGLGLPKDIYKLYIKIDAKVVVNILTALAASLPQSQSCC